MAQFRDKVYKKALPRDANDLQVIREDTKRKFARSDAQRPLTQEIIRITEDLFIPEPTPTTTISPLSGTSTIFTPSLVPSGSSTNLGIFRGGSGPDGGSNYRVNANNLGLFAKNIWKFGHPTKGSMSVSLKPHDAGGSGTVNTIFSIDDRLVVRYESGTADIRLYPNLVDDPTVFYTVDGSDWWSASIWKRLEATYDYAAQRFTLKWGEEYGTRSGAGTVTYPALDEFSILSCFVDNINADNIYHDCAFLDIVGQGITSTKILRDSFEPTGFPNKTSSTVSWSDSTPDRTLTISPVSGSFEYYIGGELFQKVAAETIQITDTDGLWMIYYDGDTLTSVNTPTHNQIENIFLTKAVVSIVYWNSTLSEGKLFEERHGMKMDGDSHVLHHETVGMASSFGLALGNILADESGDLDTHAQFSNTAGQVYDEDIEINIDTVGSTTGLEIFYMDAAGTWTWTTNAGFSVTDDGIGTRLAYNQIGVGLTEVGNNNFVLCHVFATNIDSNELIAIVGQEEYGNISAAQTGAETEILTLLLGDLLSEEMLPIATVIFQTSDSYGNAVKARIRKTSDGEDYIDWRQKPIIAGGGTSDANDKAAVDVDAVPGFLGATSGTGVIRADSGLDKIDGGDFITFVRKKTTYVVSYSDASPANAQQLVLLRTWQDETRNVGDLVNQVDYPRRLTATVTNNDGVTNMTGTITFNGIDFHGAVIQDIRTINVPALDPPTVYTTDFAFNKISSIVIDQTDAHATDIYSIGTLDYWGVAYPLASAGDVFKGVVSGIDATVVAVNRTYGTVDLGGIGIATTPVVIFYNIAK